MRLTTLTSNWGAGIYPARLRHWRERDTMEYNFKGRFTILIDEEDAHLLEQPGWTNSVTRLSRYFVRPDTGKYGALLLQRIILKEYDQTKKILFKDGNRNNYQKSNLQVIDKPKRMLAAKYMSDPAWNRKCRRCGGPLPKGYYFKHPACWAQTDNYDPESEVSLGGK